MIMVAVQGYFKNNIFINESNIPIPEEQPVIVTILDGKEWDRRSEAKRQKSIFAEFYKAIQEDPEVLGEEFDKALAERPKFRELDI
jgi:hypothetical protein